MQLVPGENVPRPFALARHHPDGGVLRVAEHREAEHVAHVGGPVMQLRAERLRLLDARVHFVDLDVRVPVGRNLRMLLLHEAGMRSLALLQHRILDIGHRRRLDLGAEELRVEARRRLDVARVQLVPHDQSRHVALLRWLITSAPALACSAICAAASVVSPLLTVSTMISASSSASGPQR